MLMLPKAFVEVVMAPLCYGTYWLRDCEFLAKPLELCWWLDVVFRSVWWLEDGSKRICYRELFPNFCLNIGKKTYIS